MEEKLVLLRNRGKIDPKSAKEYRNAGGYEGLKRAFPLFENYSLPMMRRET